MSGLLQDFVHIATFTYPHEYVVLKSLLEAAGISFVFENEATVTIVPYYSNALGGIHLKVHRDEVTAAVKIIKSLENDAPHLRIV